MIAFDLEGLDPTSSDLARELLRNRPALARHARRESAPGGGAYFALELPPPSGEHGPFLVDTGDRGRIAVRLARFSMEFDAPADGGRSSELPAALALIEDFLTGDVRLYASETNGRFCGCGLVRNERDVHRLLHRSAPGTRVTVWSWNRAPVQHVVPDEPAT